MASALKSASPLDGLALPQGGSFAIFLGAAAARFLLRGPAEAVGKISVAFGVTPPTESGRVAESGGRVAIWLGPDETLLIAEGAAPAALGAQFEAALGDAPHSLVDVSQRQVGLELQGPLAARALSAGCPLDLDERAFPVGTATRTMLAKAEIVLWRRGAARFHVEVWRSFADYAVSYLKEAARRAPPV